MFNRIDNHIKEHEKLPEKGEKFGIATAGMPLLLAALSAAPGVAGSLSSLASFFKTDYSIQGWNVTMTDTALISAVSGKLRSDLNRKVFILNAYPLDEKDLESKVMENMLNLYKNSYEITGKATELSEISTKETEKIAQFTRELKNDPNITSAIAIKERQAWLQKAAVLIKEANGLNTDLLNFMKGFTTAESGKNFSKFVLAVLSEKIRDEKRLNVKYLLYLHIESKGGEAITYKKPFWKPDGDTAFLGGIIVNYVLIGETGEILASDIIRNVHSLKFNLNVPGDPGKIYPLPFIKADQENQLKAFINQINGLVGSTLFREDADKLIKAAQDITSK